MNRNALQRLAIMRAAMGAYAVVWTLVRSANIIDTSRQPERRFDPVGPLWFLDHPLPVWITIVGVITVLVAGVALIVGWKYRITAPVVALAFLFVTTYRNSWGHIIHTENLASLQLLVLAVAPAAAVWSIDARRSTDTEPNDRDDGWWAVKAMAVLAVGTYFMAGIAKLRISGFHWVNGDVLLHQVAFDNARKIIVGAPDSPFASLFLSQHWLMAPAAIGAMLIELGAPLALIKERFAVVWVTTAVMLHFGILAIMAILFPYQLLGLAMLPLLPIEVRAAGVLHRHRKLAIFLRWQRRYPITSTT